MLLPLQDIQMMPYNILMGLFLKVLILQKSLTRIYGILNMKIPINALVLLQNGELAQFLIHSQRNLPTIFPRKKLIYMMISLYISAF